MFRRAVLKLTLAYSSLFFILFWFFSFGLYAYLERSLRGEYVTKVRERVRHELESGGQLVAFSEFSIRHNNAVMDKTRELTLENFGRGLILINMALLVFIPAVSWFFAKKTLSPIQEILEKQRQFVSDASHELRTPLTIATNEIEVALQHERNSSYYRNTLNVLKEEMLRLSTLVANLLTLAKHENALEQIKKEDVDIADVVTMAVTAFRGRSLEKGVDFKINFPSENLLVLGNHTMLEQLFVNLIDNAIKFSPEKGVIEISMSKKSNHVDILIQDQGMGISSEDQKKIFDRFYRADTSRSQASGYGLGLSIAKMVAEGHGGSICVNSTIDKGSIFTVSFPLKT